MTYAVMTKRERLIVRVVRRAEKTGAVRAPGLREEMTGIIARLAPDGWGELTWRVMWAPTSEGDYFED